MNKQPVTSVSIIIPVYNEEQTLEEIYGRVKRSDVAKLRKQIVIVDDKSTDGSRKIIERLAKDRGVTARFNAKNMGKAGAVLAGLDAADGDVVVIQDADLEYDPDEYAELLQPILLGKADVVFGSRFMGAGPHRVAYFWHYVGNKFLTTFSNMLTNLNLTDMHTCYKVFRRDVLQDVELKSRKRFGFDSEFTVKAARAGKVFYEVGISYYGRSYAEGKKITWRDGFESIWIMLKYRFFA